MSFIDPVIDAVDSVLEWLSALLKQTTASYCALETAEDSYTLVARDGSLVSVLKMDGVKFLVGGYEFEQLHEGLMYAITPMMKRPGHAIQFAFNYDLEAIKEDIAHALTPAEETAKRLNLDVDDIFAEKLEFLCKFCAHEGLYLVVWTTPQQLSAQQLKSSKKKQAAILKKGKIPPMKHAQGLLVGYKDLRESHGSFTRSLVNEIEKLDITIELLEVHKALQAIRMSVDPDFTSYEWTPYLPGDRIPVRESNYRLKEQPDYTNHRQDVSNIMWPSLASQLIPRDGEDLNMRICRIGDKLYAPVAIDLFPKHVSRFAKLFSRIHAAKIPWRVSFMIESGGLSGNAFAIKSSMAAIMSFMSAYNGLISDAKHLLNYIDVNTDDAVVKLRVMFATWVPVGQEALLRTYAAELVKAVQGWGNCEVSEVSGDPFGAALGSALGLNIESSATPSLAPMSDVLTMLPITRPASPWEYGAMLFRSPDGKLWPYQPGSSLQTTWIDLMYARPGSGKSVLSNAINLALCFLPGLERLPRISIIDIGPSSSGLISLLQEALPKEQKHLVAYHRMRMTRDFAINPFDTQLGARTPTPQERSFLVNFMTLLATPLGSNYSYDGMNDMVGLIVDELYKNFSDTENPNRYVRDVDDAVDKKLDLLNIHVDENATWWEVTDLLFEKGMIREATLAQRHAVPLLADATSTCRTPAITDLFGKVTTPTHESLVEAFSRMISSAIREYPILSQITRFDLGEARIVSFDLDEVAKTGGEAADRQTAVMYMLARYIMARHYYFTMENLADLPPMYQDFHRSRIMEINEDPKRLVYDEFHRTSKSRAVRDQVIVDMREGRKWNVQVALISQSLDDFEEVMVEFATSIFIMDAGPVQTIEKSAAIFGLSTAEKHALRTRVHGPRAGGGTFIAQFATKHGLNTQLITNTLGPIELWAFSTTVEDARIRNALYQRIGPKAARRVLAYLYPGGTITGVMESRLALLRDTGQLENNSSQSIMAELIEELVQEYHTNDKLKG
jgi:intracellular multiplication protein IcmB